MIALAFCSDRLRPLQLESTTSLDIVTVDHILDPCIEYIDLFLCAEEKLVEDTQSNC